MEKNFGCHTQNLPITKISVINPKNKLIKIMIIIIDNNNNNNNNDNNDNNNDKIMVKLGYA